MTHEEVMQMLAETGIPLRMTISRKRKVLILRSSPLLLRCVQLRIHISELDLLTIGTVLDMYTELQRDDEPHDQLASQDDFDRF